MYLPNTPSPPRVPMSLALSVSEGAKIIALAEKLGITAEWDVTQQASILTLERIFGGHQFKLQTTVGSGSPASVWMDLCNKLVLGIDKQISDAGGTVHPDIQALLTVAGLTAMYSSERRGWDVFKQPMGKSTRLGKVLVEIHESEPFETWQGLCATIAQEIYELANPPVFEEENK